MNRLFIAFIGIVVCTLGVAAQDQPQQTNSAQNPATTIQSTAQEVVLDMTFRDKKGKPIRDLRQEEIHISEDGAEQKLSAFRLVEGKTQTVSAPGTPVAPQTLDPMREIRLVTLVFEGLDVEGKRFFRQALKDLLDMTPEQNLYFSVLTVDQRLHVVQPFTADHASLLKSVDKAAMWSFIQYQNNSTEVKSSLKEVVDQGEPPVGGGSGSGPSAGAIQGQVNYRMAKMQYDMLQAAEAADREYNARATIDALMALVRAQSELPGRKIVLYFNPSLIIPEMVKEQYSNLISAANRANITFYTVDPKGLLALTSSASAHSRDEVTFSHGSTGNQDLSGASREIRDAQMRGGVGEVSTSQARAMETAEGALRANPLLWLRDLAQQTGGTTISETNDYRAPLRAALEEVRSYYEAAYIPHIGVYDGRFRKILVRVDRPDVVVHTRSGYFALPPLKGGQQLQAYEMPLLNALSAAQSPHDLDFQAAAERFNDHGQKVEYMVTLEAPQKALTFAPQPDNKSAALNVTLLVVIKKPNGEIVEKFSKQFAIQVGLENIEGYKQGNLLQTFRTELSPGEYSLEAAVMDRNNNRVGVIKNSLSVPQPSNKLSVSDVVVVRRTDSLKDGQILDAFYFPGGKIVPTLTSTLKGGAGNILPFYLSIYPDRAIKEPPKLTMSFYKEGQYLGSAEAPPLPEVQADGRIPYPVSLPADKFIPGSYEIRIGVVQGSAKVEKDVAFQVN